MQTDLFVRGSDNTTLYYERHGQGPGIVLCDGFLCDGYIWKYLLPFLKNEFEVIHWHYPGHGKSREPPRFADLSPPRLADDLERVTEHAGVDRVTVVGHSLGVQVALECWRRHPHLVSSLILMCGSPGNLVRDFHESAILGYAIPLLDVMHRFVPKLAMSAWQSLPAKHLLKLALLFREVNPHLIQTKDLETYLSQLNRVEFSVALRMLESAGQHDASSYLNQIDVPVLVIAGQDDRFTPPHRSAFLGSSIPKAKLMMVPGGTHTLPVEQPDLVNLKIKRFLFGLEPGATTVSPHPAR